MEEFIEIAKTALPIYLILKIIIGILYIILPFKVYKIKSNTDITANNSHKLNKQVESLLTYTKNLQDEIQCLKNEIKKSLDNQGTKD